MSDRFDFATLEKAGKVLCAVSGGADSVYLLHRCLEGAAGHGYAVCAAHYDHGLRGEESTRDSRFVADMCRELGVECLTGRGDVRSYARERRLGTEEAARELRYAFLQEAAGKMGAQLIATAHNAGDNAETMLLALARGAGLRGLGGIPPRRGNIVRPMLAVTRAEVEEYLAARGIAHVEDSTNALDDYARNRLRHQLREEVTHFPKGQLFTAHFTQPAVQNIRSISLALVQHQRQRIAGQIGQGRVVFDHAEVQNWLARSKVVKQFAGQLVVYRVAKVQKNIGLCLHGAGGFGGHGAGLFKLFA